MAISEQKETSLVPARSARQNGNGHRQTALAVTNTAVKPNGNGHPISPAAGQTVRVSLVEYDRIGWRGWWRTAQIARVLGLLSFYLFLENYEARSKFNRRMAARAREAASTERRGARLRAWWHELVVRAVDRLIRAVRYIVFRGADASKSKEARLAKQGAWFVRSLVKLGPTFIKMGQALGTRGDLLPLAYVKELATLQDKVPPFPTSEAYARRSAAGTMSR